jgi:hypothetical protein
MKAGSENTPATVSIHVGETWYHFDAQGSLVKKDEEDNS